MCSDKSLSSPKIESVTPVVMFSVSATAFHADTNDNDDDDDEIIHYSLLSVDLQHDSDEWLLKLKQRELESSMENVPDSSDHPENVDNESSDPLHTDEELTESDIETLASFQERKKQKNSHVANVDEAGPNRINRRKKRKRNVAKEVKSQTTRDFSNRTRTKNSPSKFSDLIASLSDEQKKWVKETGFGDLLNFSLRELPHRLAFTLLQSLDED
ncbi:hypothetical protein POM88_041215 [Heracleum sosnowskyi]|uniref:Uncharacterized protein n=1 Tax=Heracleum sosnowskyi TaxID=360622 RepID=A0AAD8HFZ3_9APIA|nr:hypothetical protein POM88_041215 [Heracleum sosnowskyi]